MQSPHDLCTVDLAFHRWGTGEFARSHIQLVVNSACVNTTIWISATLAYVSNKLLVFVLGEYI